MNVGGRWVELSASHRLTAVLQPGHYSVTFENFEVRGEEMDHGIHMVLYWDTMLSCGVFRKKVPRSGFSSNSSYYHISVFRRLADNSLALPLWPEDMQVDLKETFDSGWGKCIQFLLSNSLLIIKIWCRDDVIVPIAAFSRFTVSSASEDLEGRDFIQSSISDLPNSVSSNVIDAKRRHAQVTVKWILSKKVGGTRIQLSILCSLVLIRSCRW